MTPSPDTAGEARTDLLSAIETLLKEAIHSEVRAYLRGLDLDLTKKDLPA